jgi:hypothetical protein
LATPIQIPLTQEQYKEKVAQLETLGVHLTGTQGAISKEGVTVNYAYDGHQVVLNVVHKPFALPMSVVEGKIKEWFNS